MEELLQMLGLGAQKPVYSQGFTNYMNQNNLNSTGLTSNDYLNYGNSLVPTLGVQGAENAALQAQLNTANGATGYVDPNTQSMNSAQNMMGIAQLANMGLQGYMGLKGLGIMEDQLGLAKLNTNNLLAQSEADIASKQSAQREATGSTNISNPNYRTA